MAFSIKDFSDIRKLSEGGMGHVYLATQVALDRRVVIKELALDIQKDPKLIKRFENEAKSAAGLNHDNIIKVLDFGEDDNSFFISMEYIDGVDLEQLLGRHPFPKEIGLMVLLQAMKGLNYAHKHGVVHCDIKPGNILISKTGKVKVVDFGLARTSARADEYAAFNDPANVIMTPGYMPPEVASGEAGQDVFMDIWSTGVLAYQIICGRLPFDAVDIHQLIYSIVHEKEKDVREIAPTLPDDLANAVQACLEKKPEHRPASLDRMVECLGNYLDDLGIRDFEKMIMNYITDKDPVERAIAGILVRYHLQKGNDFLEAGNRERADAHFLEAEKYGGHNPQGKAPEVLNVKTGPRPRFGALYEQAIAQMRSPSRLGFFPQAIFGKVWPAKRAISIIGILGFVSLGAASVFMMVQKNQPGGPNSPENSKQTPQRNGLSRENHHDGKTPVVTDSGNEFFGGYAALKNELTTIAGSGNSKNQVTTVQPDKKKFHPPPVATPHDRKPVIVSDGAHFGTLKLAVEPSGATVRIDGKTAFSAELTDGKRLRQGNHSVTVFLDGYSSFSSILTIEPNATKFASISLKQRQRGTGLLHVHSYPWAEIYIDDVYQGTAPTPRPLSLTEGDHTLVLKREGFKPHSEIVHVAEGEVTRIKVQLEQ
ncbi:MAG: serine/threonine protein kinase [Chitinivibrionales bacterium]|nr:serine/threonine protein kinase [Chitinivibrionales bacterium]